MRWSRASEGKIKEERGAGLVVRAVRLAQGWEHYILPAELKHGSPSSAVETPKMNASYCYGINYAVWSE
ncbi:hypothetical protein, partial [Rectinema subterraneum]|uniref:hypothetical protein n=1 Tax=Rectinema subterraneum TaxID=2653714 RepID=UPI001C92E8AF